MGKMLSVKDLGDRAIHELYFNTRKRNRIKRSVLELEKSLLLNIDTTIKPILKQEYEDRETYNTFLAVCVKFREAIKSAEEIKYKTTLKNCHFKIYKAKKGEKVIIEDNFFKLCENKNKTTFIIFPNGFPAASKRKCKVYKDSYDFNRLDFVLMDKGKFKQKIEDFNSFSLRYKGKIFNKKFLFTKIKDSTTFYWTKIV